MSDSAEEKIAELVKDMEYDANQLYNSILLGQGLRLDYFASVKAKCAQIDVILDEQLKKSKEK